MHASVTDERFIFLGLIQSTFLGAFRKNVRKAIIYFVMSVCLSAWNNSAPTERIFMKFDILELFENLSRKSKLH